MTSSSNTPAVHLWSRLPLAVKLGSAVAALGLVAASVGAIATLQLARLNTVAASMADDNMANIGQIGEVQKDARAALIDLLRHDIADSDADTKQAEAAIAADDKAFDDAWANYVNGSHGATDQQVADLDSSWKTFRQIRDETLLPLSRAGRNADFFRADQTRLRPVVQRAFGVLDAISKTEADLGVAATRNADATYEQARATVLTLVGGGLVAASALAVVAILSVTRPIRRVRDVLSAVAEGDLTRSVEVTSSDEVGHMAEDVNRTVASLQGLVQQLPGKVQTLAVASRRISEASGHIRQQAGTTLSRADVVAATAADVAGSANAAAAGTEEMTASIHEIASTAADAVRVGHEAMATADRTNERVTHLGASSQQIGDVLSLISSIADQTNLLALNATIEAARAGDAGRGFAVVATEVKELANQTASATGDVDKKVSAIRAETGLAVEAIAGIREIIDRVNAQQATIASAVEEQTSVTSEISRSVTGAAAGATDIAETMADVAESARATSSAAEEAGHAAAELTALSGDLDALVARFTV